MLEEKTDCDANGAQLSTAIATLNILEAKRLMLAGELAAYEYGSPVGDTCREHFTLTFTKCAPILGQDNAPLTYAS